MSLDPEVVTGQEQFCATLISVVMQFVKCGILQERESCMFRF